MIKRDIVNGLVGMVDIALLDNAAYSHEKLAPLKAMEVGPPFITHPLLSLSLNHQIPLHK